MSFIYDDNYFKYEKPEHIEVLIGFRINPCPHQKIHGKCEIEKNTQIGKQFAHVFFNLLN